MEKLTKKETKVQSNYIQTIFYDYQVVTRRTKKPLVIGIVGLVGSGKTTIAKEMASLIGATIVSGDKIRICLRNEGERYENTRLIAENIMEKIIGNGGNVIIDSDFIDQKKRVSLKEKAKKVGAKVIFIRTYAELDVMLGRMVGADYKNLPDDFFVGALSAWLGTNKEAVVKLREMYRRMPHHYRWLSEVGGKWILKKLPFKVFAEIDTSNENKWKQEVKMISGQIRAKY